YKGPTELTESQKYNFRNDGRCHYMTIHNVTPDDEGVYSVIARLEPRGEARSTAELYLTTKEIKLELKPPDIPDSRVPIPTMPIRAVPPEEIPAAVVPPIPVLLPLPDEKKPPAKRVEGIVCLSSTKTHPPPPVPEVPKKPPPPTTLIPAKAPEIIDVSSKAEEVKIKTITRQKEKEAVYEKKQAIYEEKRVYIESMVEEPYDELEVEPYTEPFEEPYYEEPEEDYEEVKVQAKREVHEEWEEDYEEGQEYYVREEGYDEGEEEWEESYQEREAVQVQREVREESPERRVPAKVPEKKAPPPKVPEPRKKTVPEEVVLVPITKEVEPPPAKGFICNLKCLRKKLEYSNCFYNAIFKVPEVPKKPVPEEKKPVPVPKKEPAAPPKGTQLITGRPLPERPYAEALNMHISKVPAPPKKPVPEEKVPVPVPVAKKAPPPRGRICLSSLVEIC
uniref:Immunoglobulin I-set domain-containing protein n=1 Tax=Cavia porcellus TaxID=10141 RepID=A0A286XBA6_CAVPO